MGQRKSLVERRCPVMFVPNHRRVDRAAWKWLDHACRLAWRERGEDIKAGLVELMLYGRSPALPERD